MKAKIYLTILLFSVAFKAAWAQSTNALLAKDTTALSQSKVLVKTADNLKSGNWQDVSASFFQLAFTDLTNTSKSFNFKTSLFALKVKVDSTLLIDRNYEKHTFDRNFQFNLGVQLDTIYHFSGFTAGFTWAILNKRDSSIVRFKYPYYQAFLDRLPKLLIPFKKSLSNSNDVPQDSVDLIYNATRSIINTQLAQGVFIINEFPIKFQQFYKQQKLDLQAELHNADSLLNIQLQRVSLQPLFTFSTNGVFDNKIGKFNSVNGQLIYLKGLTTNSDGSGTELDLRSRFTLTDTTLNTLNTYRNVVDFSAGANFVFAKLHKSYFELKPYFQYKNILNGLVVNEKKQNVYFNAELRLRITDTMWLPLTLKYDVKNTNFLGFLNVTFNLDAFKTQAK